ncbi:MAG TPA: hypothetical protein VFK05_36180 [Polyangiaceae bacterium]|nr:hypothetical protein [Polyangiaceae bacterium]
MDERNPILLMNDGVYDNWQGEYAILLASSGGPQLAEIVVGTSPNSADIGKNIDGWQTLVKRARDSGLSDIPDPKPSVADKLVRPSSGQIEDTIGSRSAGAILINERSKELSLPYRPLAVVTGGRLTDVANAYLMDPTVVERTVVISALGAATDTGGAMSDPNGEMDPWADVIVTSRFRYVQVSAFYDQLMDVPASRFSELPDNALGQWIQEKQPKVWDLPKAADQVAVLAVGLPTFAAAVDRVSAAATVAADATAGPELLSAPNGASWLVRRCNAEEAGKRFWQALSELPVSPPSSSN